MNADGFGGMHRTVKAVLDTFGPPEYTQPPQPDYFLRLAAAYSAGGGVNRKGFISTLTQLARFDWMSPSKAVKCVNRLESAVCMDSLGKKVNNQADLKNDFSGKDEITFEHHLWSLLTTNESTHTYPVLFEGVEDGWNKLITLLIIPLLQVGLIL
jgi:hypothetical protein